MRRTLDMVDLVVMARDTKDCFDSRFATLNTKWEKRSRCCIRILNTALLHIFLNNHAALLIPTNIDFSTGYYSGDDVCQATIIWYSLSRLPLKINYQSTCHSRALRWLLISYRNLNCKGFIIFSMRKRWPKSLTRRKASRRRNGILRTQWTTSIWLSENDFLRF